MNRRERERDGEAVEDCDWERWEEDRATNGRRGEGDEICIISVMLKMRVA